MIIIVLSYYAMIIVFSCYAMIIIVLSKSDFVERDFFVI